MSRTTKLELVQINARLASENHELRAELSSLRVSVKANSQRGASASSSQRPVRVSEYADHAAACAKCKELAASEWNKVWSFTVTDNKIIAAARQW